MIDRCYYLNLEVPIHIVTSWETITPINNSIITTCSTVSNLTFPHNNVRYCKEPQNDLLNSNGANLIPRLACTNKTCACLPETTSNHEGLPQEVINEYNDLYCTKCRNTECIHTRKRLQLICSPDVRNRSKENLQHLQSPAVNRQKDTECCNNFQKSPRQISRLLFNEPEPDDNTLFYCNKEGHATGHCSDRNPEKVHSDVDTNKTGCCGNSIRSRSTFTKNNRRLATNQSPKRCKKVPFMACTTIATDTNDLARRAALSFTKACCTSDCWRDNLKQHSYIESRECTPCKSITININKGRFSDRPPTHHHCNNINRELNKANNYEGNITCNCPCRNPNLSPAPASPQQFRTHRFTNTGSAEKINRSIDRLTSNVGSNCRDCKLTICKRQQQNFDKSCEPVYFDGSTTERRPRSRNNRRQIQDLQMVNACSGPNTALSSGTICQSNKKCCRAGCNCQKLHYDAKPIISVPLKPRIQGRNAVPPHSHCYPNTRCGFNYINREL